MERALDSDRVATLPRSWWLTWHYGPDAGARQRLDVGRHVVGRGTPVHDPALAPHHALFEVSPAGALTVTWLCGVAHQRQRSSPQVVESGAWLELGDSLVQCTLVTSTSTIHDTAHIRDGALVRTPRVPSVWTPPTEADDPNLRPGGHGVHSGHGVQGLVPAALALAGALVMALVMHQPMFVMFGLVGALVAVGTWVAQRIVVARGRRRTRRLLDQSAREFAEQHRRSVHTLVRACAAARHRDATLWSRRAAHHDAFLVSPGRGDVPLPDPLGMSGVSGVSGAPGVLADVAFGIDLGPGARVAIRGPRAHAVARAFVVQLATSCGPADLCIALDVTPDAPVTPDTPLGGAWSSLLDLPHLEQGAAPHTIHVTERPDQLALRTSPLRRALADTARHALLVVLADDDAVPHLCTHVCTTTDGPWGEWRVTGATTTTGSGSATRVRIAGISERAAAECAAALRGLRDPEDPRTADDALPSTVDLAALLGPHLHRRLGHAGAGAGGHGPSTPIGVANDGVVDLDLVRDGPHALIAGTTGSGKSQLLRSMVLGMAARTAPQHLQFVLVDYKGGATFDDLAALPHVVGVVTDLDAQRADRVLRSLHAELRRREAVLREHRVADLEALHAVEHGTTMSSTTMSSTATPSTPSMARLVVIVDEFAALVHEQSDFLHALLGIAQRGRSLGVHLVLATQRPNGVISDDIRANTNLRLALRLHDTADAIDVVGIADPTTLPRHRPGRAVLRLGTDEYVTFQAATCDAPSMVRSICDALTQAGARASDIPAPPWLPPLPEVLAAHDTAEGAVGLVDDPDHQTRHPLRWSPADGNLLVVGSPGSGTSTTLTTIVQHTLALGTHHVYALTDGTTALGSAAHVVAVYAHDTELVARLLHRVARQASAHDGRPIAPDTCGTAPVVLVVDTIEGVRGALDHPSTLDELDALDALLAHPDPRLVVVAATARPMAVPSALLARCANRWVHHLHDPHDAVHLGVRAVDVPAAIPGRAHVMPLGMMAQVALPGTTTDAPALAPPDAIRPIPAQLHPCELEHDTLEHGTLEQVHELAIGRGVVSGNTRSIELYPGEHLTVLGGARTGRTTALVRIATAWREAHPDGVIEVVAPRRTRTGPADIALRALHTPCSPTASTPHEAILSPRLVVVDDADLVDTLDLGSTGNTSSTGDTGSTGDTSSTGRSAAQSEVATSIVIAARPDALRQQYGHWSAAIRRSRIGLIAASGTELDGDLLGTMLPRRMPLAARPGLMWCVADGTTELVQVAADNLAGHGVRLAPR